MKYRVTYKYPDDGAIDLFEDYDSWESACEDMRELLDDEYLIMGVKRLA